MLTLAYTFFGTVGNGKEGECRCQSDHVRITVERLLSESDWVKLPTVSSETMDKTAFGEVPNLVRKENIMCVYLYPFLLEMFLKR